MKGLLYKDFYLGKKTYILHGVIAGAMALLGVLVSLSSVCGNLTGYANNNPGGFEIVIKIFMYLPIFMIVIGVQGISQSICSDYQSGWMLYEYNLPVKNLVKVGAHYIVGLIIVAMGMLIGAVHMLIISEISGVDLVKGDFYKMLLIGFLGLAEIAFFIPISLRVKTQKYVSTISVLLVCIVWFISFLQLAVVSEDELYTKVARDVKFFKETIYDYWWVIIPVVLVTSFFYSVKTMKAKRV